MARKNKEGKYIISAGEVGVYTVCPEAWRLQYVLRRKVTESESVGEGRRLHNWWAREYSEANSLGRMARTTIFLVILLTILVTLIIHY